MKPKAKSELCRLLELLIIVSASTIPTFIMAAKIDDDEFWKASGAIAAAATAGAITAAYRMWKKD